MTDEQFKELMREIEECRDEQEAQNDRLSRWIERYNREATGRRIYAWAIFLTAMLWALESAFHWIGGNP